MDVFIVRYRCSLEAPRRRRHLAGSAWDLGYGEAFVWARDGGQCTFVSADGRRCSERHALEFHHDEPDGFGGDRSPDNIRLACRLCMAELDYGKEKMDRYRRSPDRVGEPAPAFNF